MPLSKLNYIDVGFRVTLNSSGNHDYDTTPEHIDEIFIALTARQQKKILLYFHGSMSVKKQP